MFTLRLHSYTTEDLLRISKVDWRVYEDAERTRLVTSETLTDEDKNIFKSNIAQPDGVAYYVFATPYSLNTDTDGVEIEKAEETVGPYKTINLAGSRTVELYPENAIETPSVHVDEALLISPASPSFTIRTSRLRAKGDSLASVSYVIENNKGEVIWSAINTSNKDSITVDKALIDKELYGKLKIYACHNTINNGSSQFGVVEVDATNHSFHISSNTHGVIAATTLEVTIADNLNNLPKEIYGLVLYDKDINKALWENLDVSHVFYIPNTILADNSSYELRAFETAANFSKNDYLAVEVTVANPFMSYYIDRDYIYNYKMETGYKDNTPYSNRVIDELDGPVTIDYDLGSKKWVLYKDFPDSPIVADCTFELPDTTTRFVIKPIANYKFLVAATVSNHMTLYFMQYNQDNNTITKYSEFALPLDLNIDVHDEHTCTVSSDGKTIYFLASSGVLQSIDLVTLEHTVCSLKPAYSPETSLTFINNSELVAYSANTDGTIYKYDIISKVWSGAIKVPNTHIETSMVGIVTRDGNVTYLPISSNNDDLLVYDYVNREISVKDTGVINLAIKGIYRDKSGKVVTVSVTEDSVRVNSFK